MDRYSSRVFSLIVRIIDNTEDAEEVTQDVFVKAFNALPRFDGRSSFATWLFRIAYNEAVSAVRRKRRSVISMDDSVLRTIADEKVDHFFDSDDPRLAALSDAIELLSSEERALLSFYYYEGFPISKAADIMNISESAAKVRL
ncbi:MAG: sigma-70 family RNA polymerase sigma factor, partial [Muribaculaceae bacterium]|nr:sigma-70 family RNA polymerase sigma factor [Muribaculaceae bacterium]